MAEERHPKIVSEDADLPPALTAEQMMPQKKDQTADEGAAVQIREDTADAAEAADAADVEDTNDERDIRVQKDIVDANPGWFFEIFCVFFMKYRNFS